VQGAYGVKGGTGVVIISYVTADFGFCSGGTKTVVGSETIHTFTSSGDFIVRALKTAANLAVGSVKSINGLAENSMKSANGLT